MRPKSHQAGSGSAEGGLMDERRPEEEQRAGEGFVAKTTDGSELIDDPEKAKQMADAEKGKREEAIHLRKAAGDVRALAEKYPGYIGRVISDLAQKFEKMAANADDEAQLKGELRAEY